MLPRAEAVADMADRATMPLMARLVWLASWPAKSSEEVSVSDEGQVLGGGVTCA